MRYNEEFQNERNEDTRNLREKSREDRKDYENELKAKRLEVEDHFHALKERGLRKVDLTISDEHKGLSKGTAGSLSWCTPPALHLPFYAQYVIQDSL